MWRGRDQVLDRVLAVKMVRLSPAPRRPPTASAIRLDPRNATAHLNLGSALLDLKRFPEAETATREAIRLDPRNALAHLNLGAAVFPHKRYREGEAATREAIRLRPDYADPSAAC